MIYKSRDLCLQGRAPQPYPPPRCWGGKSSSQCPMIQPWWWKRSRIMIWSEWLCSNQKQALTCSPRTPCWRRPARGRRASPPNSAPCYARGSVSAAPSGAQARVGRGACRHRNLTQTLLWDIFLKVFEIFLNLCLDDCLLSELMAVIERYFFAKPLTYKVKRLNERIQTSSDS